MLLVILHALNLYLTALTGEQSVREENSVGTLSYCCSAHATTKAIHRLQIIINSPRVLGRDACPRVPYIPVCILLFTFVVRIHSFRFHFGVSAWSLLML